LAKLSREIGEEIRNIGFRILVRIYTVRLRRKIRDSQGREWRVRERILL
jgi:hypothetical protein